MKKTGLTLLAACAVVCGLAAADRPAVMGSPLAEADWQLCPGAEMVEEGGRHILRITVPEGRETGDPALSCARLKVDLRPFRSNALSGSLPVRATGVSQPQQRWNGIKVMLHYIDENGKAHWDNAQNCCGTFDFTRVGFSSYISREAVEGTLYLGLQDATGTVDFDLDGFEVSVLFEQARSDYRIDYPAAVRNTPLLRGVMSPPSTTMTAGDVRDLAGWGATLVRYQIGHGRMREAAEDKAAYLAELDKALDNIAELAPVARECGVKFVIDLHLPPGGYLPDTSMRMFHEAEWADCFVAVWRHIAERFRGEPAVWAYDLVNEPFQNEPSPHGYRELQRRAAAAVREVDPDTPVIVESNEWSNPRSFAYLEPLEMDNVIYQVHMYAPFEYTHQFVSSRFSDPRSTPFVPYSWSRDELKEHLQPVIDFQKKHHARIFVGEFSAVNWAPDAGRYLADCIGVFEELGWDWSYHAFREWGGWSVEHEAEPGGEFRPSADNPRKRALLEGLRRPERPASF